MVSTRQMTVTGGSGVDDVPFDGASNTIGVSGTSSVATPASANVGSGIIREDDALAAGPSGGILATNGQTLLATISPDRPTTATTAAIINPTSSRSFLGRPPTMRLRPLQLFDLPVEILDTICSYVGYKKVAQIRVVSIFESNGRNQF